MSESDLMPDPKPGTNRPICVVLVIGTILVIILNVTLLYFQPFDSVVQPRTHEYYWMIQPVDKTPH